MGAGVVIMGSVFMSLGGIVTVEGVLPAAGSVIGPGMRIVRLDPVPVPGVCVPVAEFGVPSAGRTCSGFGLLVEFIWPGVDGAVSVPVWAQTQPLDMSSAAAMAVV